MALDWHRRLRTGLHFVAAAVTAMAICAFLATAASGAKRPGRPALATGTSDTVSQPGRLPEHWRLEGRHLTVRLPGPLVAFHPSVPGGLATVRVTAECGANTVALNMFEGAPYPWAAVTGASVTVAPATRLVRVDLPRDLAGMTNLCSMVITGPMSAAPPFVPLFVEELRAPMGVRRGRTRGCRPGPLERVVLETARIRVTAAHASDGGSTVDGYRACLLAHGAPRQIDRGADEGGAGGAGTSPEHFTASGKWLAWEDGYLPHSDLGGVRSWTVRLVDMTVGRPRSIDSGPGVVTSLAAGAGGAVVWVVEPDPITAAATPYASSTFTYPAAELRAQRPGGSTIILDRTGPVTCPIGCHVDTAADLTNLAVSPDGRTVTWNHAAATRRAPLP